LAVLKYRPEIDGLRALAVLPVVFYHACLVFNVPVWFSGMFSGGYVGVDVFFVISGYLITSIIVKELNRNAFSFKDFYVRRARRILPALSVVVLATTIGAVCILDPSALRAYGKSLIGNGFFVSNYTFYKEAGYFSGPAEYIPLLHTWSLALEEQFYLFFPPILWAIWVIKKSVAQTVLAGLLFVSIGLAHYGSIHWPNASFYLLHARAWELLVGSFLALNADRMAEFCRRLSGISAFLCGLGLVAVIGSFILFEPDTRHPSLYTLFPVVGTAFILAFGVKQMVVARLLSLNFLVVIGRISYSMYLWHVPIFALMLNYYLGAKQDGVLQWIGVIFALSWLSWRYVETPFRTRAFPSSAVLLSAFAVLVAMIATGLALKTTDGWPQRFDMPSQLEKSFARTPKHAEGGVACFKAVEAHMPLEPCRFGVVNQKLDYLVLGDSHAFSALHAVQSYVRGRNLSGAAITIPACMPLVDATVMGRTKPDQNCEWFNRRFLDFVEASEVRNVVLIARWWHYFGGAAQLIDARTGQSSLSTEEEKKLFAVRLRETLAALQSLGTKVYILRPIPEFSHSARQVYSALYRPFSSMPSDAQLNEALNAFAISRSDYLSGRRPVDNLLEELAESGLARLIDPLPALCDAAHCQMGSASQSWYFDDDHLSMVGADRLIPQISAAFDVDEKN